MKKIIKITYQSGDMSELSVKVNKKIEEGFELYGNLIESKSLGFIQTMVKYESN